MEGSCRELTREGRPQMWGLGKWLGTPLKMQHVTKCYAYHGLEWIL